jgi:hypothetical protein
VVSNRGNRLVLNRGNSASIAKRSDARCWPVSDREAPPTGVPSRLHLRLFCHFERIIDFDAQVPHGAFSLLCPSKSWTARRFFVRR